MAFTFPSLSPATAATVKRVRKAVIGRRTMVPTPFGRKLVTYADYTASGRMLKFVESAMQQTVAPMYANTHTEASATGLQTGRFREEARGIVRRGLGAGDDDTVLFCGAGSTAAIAKLQQILRPVVLHLGAPVVVFVGPCEHHSNEVSWREMEGVVLVVIEEDARGWPDLVQLERELERHTGAALKLGSFNAGSNVTGIIPPIDAISSMLHAHGGFAGWDYAGSAPYVSINMHPAPTSAPSSAFRKDAVYVSPHKFVGGPGSSGVLSLSAELVQKIQALSSSCSSSSIPTMPGGGTVTYVSQTRHFYSESLVAKEEAGTPAILADIRTGLAFKVKEQVGASTIETLERYWGGRALETLGQMPNVMLIGADRGAYANGSDRLAIISFNIKWTGPKHRTPPAFVGEGIEENVWLLHQHFVCAVLNDVYGIQSRSGCSCTGPYGHRLFGVDPDGPVSTEMARHATELGREAPKFGWVRINLSYFTDESEFTFLMEAIRQVSESAWKLLPLYRCDAASGRFVHKFSVDAAAEADRIDLLSLAAPTAVSSRARAQARTRVTSKPLAKVRAQTLREAKTLYQKVPAQIKKLVASGDDVLDKGDSWMGSEKGGPPPPTEWMLRNRWFALGSDVAIVTTQKAATLVVRRTTYPVPAPPTSIVKRFTVRLSPSPMKKHSAVGPME